MTDINPTENKKFRPRHALLGAALMASVAFPASAQFEGKTYEGIEDLPNIRLTLSDWGPSESATGKGVRAMIDYVAEASQGKITIEPFWNASLMTPPEHAAGIAAGLADLGNIAPIYTPTDFPVGDWLTSFGTLARGGTAFGFMSMNAAHWEFNLTNEAYLQELRDFGLEPIQGTTSPAYSMLCTKPLQTLADFRGVRTRTTGNTYSEQVQALGMVPVPVQLNETYEALSRGIIDCVVLFTTGYIDYGLMDIPGDKYYINLEFPGVNGSLMAFNKDRWDDLPEVAQEIILDGQVMRMKSNNSSELPRLRELSAMIEEDSRVHAVQPDQEVIDTLLAKQDEQLANLVANPPRGMDDAQAAYDHYMALTEKWQNIVTELGVERVPPTSVEAALASWNNDPDWDAYYQRVVDEIINR
ncbi:MAG: hypothetical protein WDA25_01425 [Paracoccaceae bacterium]